jgi:hypothetical protein
MDPAAIAILTAEKVAPSSTLLSGNVTNGSIAYLTDKVVSRLQEVRHGEHGRDAVRCRAARGAMETTAAAAR